MDPSDRLHVCLFLYLYGWLYLFCKKWLCGNYVKNAYVKNEYVKIDFSKSDYVKIDYVKTDYVQCNSVQNDYAKNDYVEIKYVKIDYRGFWNHNMKYAFSWQKLLDPTTSQPLEVGELLESTMTQLLDPTLNSNLGLPINM